MIANHRLLLDLYAYQRVHATYVDPRVTRSSFSGSARKLFGSLSRLEPNNTAHGATSNTLT